MSSRVFNACFDSSSVKWYSLGLNPLVCLQPIDHGLRVVNTVPEVNWELGLAERQADLVLVELA
jgi:hypothetical protein